MRQLYQKRPLCFYIMIFTICMLVLQIFCNEILTDYDRFAVESKTKMQTAMKIETFLATESEMISESASATMVSLTGTVEKIEEKNKHQIIYLTKCYLSAKSAEYLKNKQLNIESFVKNEGVVCYMKEFEDVKLGMSCFIKGKIRPFSCAENEGQFDAKSYYHSIGYEAEILDGELLFSGQNYDRIGECLRNYKEQIRRFYYTYLPEEDASILSAMLLGEKSGMEREIKSLYQKNGIAHILAISGLHISLLGMGVYKLLKKVFVPPPICAIIGIAVVLLYGKLVQGTSSLIRAMCMFILFLLADILSQTYDMITAMAFSAAVLLIKQPANLSSSGFWMSYFAVIGIAVVSPVLNNAFEHVSVDMADWLTAYTKVNLKFLRSDSFKKGINAFLASVSVQLVTLPVQLWYYYAFPPYAVILNLFIVPMLGIVICSGVIGGVLRVSLLLCPARLVLYFYKCVCISMQGLPRQTIITGRPHAVQIIIYYLLLIFWLAFLSKQTEKEQVGCDKQKNKFKYKSYFSHILRWLLPVLACFILLVSFRKNNVVDFLSIGQGDCAVLRTRNGECFVIDGGSSSETEVGNYRLIPYLKYNGISHVDLIFVSHSHEDHVSGVLELLEQKEEAGITIGALALSEYAKSDTKYDLLRKCAFEARVPVIYLHPMQKLSVGKTQFICLSPRTDMKIEDENDESLTLYAKLGETNYLFTGDLTEKSEGIVLTNIKNAGISKIDCLKIAHHGAKTSTSALFLDVIKPNIAVISCGKNNRYGHPHVETINRLENRNIKTYVTTLFGQISVYAK